MKQLFKEIVCLLFGHKDTVIKEEEGFTGPVFVTYCGRCNTEIDSVYYDEA